MRIFTYSIQLTSNLRCPTLHDITGSTLFASLPLFLFDIAGRAFLAVKDGGNRWLVLFVHLI